MGTCLGSKVQDLRGTWVYYNGSYTIQAVQGAQDRCFHFNETLPDRSCVTAILRQEEQWLTGRLKKDGILFGYIRLRKEGSHTIVSNFRKDGSLEWSSDTRAVRHSHERKGYAVGGFKQAATSRMVPVLDTPDSSTILERRNSKDSARKASKSSEGTGVEVATPCNLEVTATVVTTDAGADAGAAAVSPAEVSAAVAQARGLRAAAAVAHDTSPAVAETCHAGVPACCCTPIGRFP